MGDRCETCSFWSRYEADGAEVGNCRIRAPRIIGKLVTGHLMDHIYEATAYPMTHQSDLCGEYQELAI